MNESLILNIRKQLSLGLPGVKAQNKMIPETRFFENFELDINNYRKSSVLVLLYLKNGKFYIPFTKRHNYNGPHGGQISLPGGKQNKEDNSLQETAIRETYEEIGVTINKECILGSLSPLYIPKSSFYVQPYIAYIDFTPTFIKDDYEVESIIEAPLDLLIDDKIIENKQYNYNDNYINIPYYNVNGNEIWGATAMIISETKEIILNIKTTK